MTGMLIVRKPFVFTMLIWDNPMCVSSVAGFLSCVKTLAKMIAKIYGLSLIIPSLQSPHLADTAWIHSILSGGANVVLFILIGASMYETYCFFIHKQYYITIFASFLVNRALSNLNIQKNGEEHELGHTDLCP